MENETGKDVGAAAQPVAAAEPSANTETRTSEVISLTQLAEKLALDRRQRRGAAAPETPGPVTEQDAVPAKPAVAEATPVKADEQSPPPTEERGIDALWNEDAEEAGAAEAGTEIEAAAADGAATEEEAATEAEAPVEGEKPGVRKLQKRVDKLTASLRETQEALARANEALTKAPAEAAAPGQFGWHPVVRAADDEMRQLNGYLDWCRKNPEGGEYREGEKAMELDADQVRRVVERVELRRTEVLAERAATVATLRQADAAERAACEQVYRKAYGNLEAGTSAEAREFQKIMTQAPWLKQFPNWKVWVGDAIRGRKARELAMTKAGKPSARSREAGASPAPVTTLPVAAAGPVDPAERTVRKAAEDYQKSGSMDSLARVIAARRAAARAR